MHRDTFIFTTGRSICYLVCQAPTLGFRDLLPQILYGMRYAPTVIAVEQSDVRNKRVYLLIPPIKREQVLVTIQTLEAGWTMSEGILFAPEPTLLSVQTIAALVQ